MGEDRIAHAGQNGPSSAEPIRRALHTLDRLPQGALGEHPRPMQAVSSGRLTEGETS
jgi:hypothetical protein